MDTATKGQQTRERVLRTTMELINVKGYHNTSIGDIIEATGVKKGNLYFHFPNKEELVFELITAARDEYQAYLARHMTGDTPLARIESILRAIYEYHRRSGFVGGCIFGNIALEMGDESPRFAQLIRGIFDEWIGIFTKLYRQAQEAGELRKDHNPAALARLTVATLEGGIMQARLSKKGSDFLDCVTTLRRFLHDAR